MIARFLTPPTVEVTVPDSIQLPRDGVKNASGRGLTAPEPLELDVARSGAPPVIPSRPAIPARPTPVRSSRASPSRSRLRAVAALATVVGTALAVRFWPEDEPPPPPPLPPPEVPIVVPPPPPAPTCSCPFPNTTCEAGQPSTKCRLKAGATWLLRPSNLKVASELNEVASGYSVCIKPSASPTWTCSPVGAGKQRDRKTSQIVLSFDRRASVARLTTEDFQFGGVDVEVRTPTGTVASLTGHTFSNGEQGSKSNRIIASPRLFNGGLVFGMKHDVVRSVVFGIEPDRQGSERPRE